MSNGGRDYDIAKLTAQLEKFNSNPNRHSFPRFTDRHSPWTRSFDLALSKPSVVRRVREFVRQENRRRLNHVISVEELVKDLRKKQRHLEDALANDSAEMINRVYRKPLLCEVARDPQIKNVDAPKWETPQISARDVEANTREYDPQSVRPMTPQTSGRQQNGHPMGAGDFPSTKKDLDTTKNRTLQSLPAPTKLRLLEPFEPQRSNLEQQQQHSRNLPQPRNHSQSENVISEFHFEQSENHRKHFAVDASRRAESQRRSKTIDLRVVSKPAARTDRESLLPPRKENVNRTQERKSRFNFGDILSVDDISTDSADSSSTSEEMTISHKAKHKFDKRTNVVHSRPVRHIQSETAVYDRPMSKVKHKEPWDDAVTTGYSEISTEMDSTYFTLSKSPRKQGNFASKGQRNTIQRGRRADQLTTTSGSDKYSADLLGDGFIKSRSQDGDSAVAADFDPSSEFDGLSGSFL